MSNVPENDFVIKNETKEQIFNCHSMLLMKERSIKCSKQLSEEMSQVMGILYGSIFAMYYRIESKPRSVKKISSDYENHTNLPEEDKGHQNCY